MTGGLYSGGGVFTIDRSTFDRGGITLYDSPGRTVTATVTNSLVRDATDSGIGVKCGTGGTATVVGNQVVRAFTTGISIVDCSMPVVQDNLVTESGAGRNDIRYHAAMAVHGEFTLGPTGTVRNNRGGGNRMNAIRLGGTVRGDLTWITPRGGSVVNPLGYIADAVATTGPGTVTIPAGSVVKARLDLGPETRLDATAPGSVFTSLSDNSVGIRTCFDPAGSCGSGAISGLNAMDFGAVTIQRSGILVTEGDLRMTGTTVRDGGGVGLLNADEVTVVDSRFQRVQGVVIPGVDTSGAIAGRARARDQPDGRRRRHERRRHRDRLARLVQRGPGRRHDRDRDTIVRRVEGPGIRVVDFDRPLVRRNAVVSAVDLVFPAQAIELTGVVVTLGPGGDVDGNAVARNTMDAIALRDVTVLGGFTWIGVTNSNALHPPGYVAPWNLTVRGPGTLVVPGGAVVKLGGGDGSDGYAAVPGLTLDGVDLDASGGPSTFAAWTNPAYGPPPCPVISPRCQGWRGAGFRRTDFGGIFVWGRADQPPAKVTLLLDTVVGGTVQTNSVVVDVRLSSLEHLVISNSTGNRLERVFIDTDPAKPYRSGLLFYGATATVDRSRIEDVPTVIGSGSVVTLTCSNIARGGIFVGGTGSLLENRLNIVDSNVYGRWSAGAGPDIQGNGSDLADLRGVYWGQPGGPGEGQIYSRRTISGSRNAPAPCAPAPN